VEFQLMTTRRRIDWWAVAIAITGAVTFWNMMHQ
jgi:hypothetical protein